MKIKTVDHMMGTNKNIIIRFKPDDLIKLPCGCNYDEKLCTENGNEVMLLNCIEIKGEDGSWKLYPSVVWQDGRTSESQLQDG